MDDGSPDHCGRICDEYSLQDNRIIVHHLKNGGQSAARNIGMKLSKGQYIIFVDGDDWIDVNYCKNMYNIISDNNDVDVIYAGYSYTFQNANLDVTTVDPQFKGKVILTDETKVKLMLAALYLPGYLSGEISKQAEYSIALWGKSFKRKFLLSNHLQCTEGISPFEDNIFCAEMLNSNPILYFSSDILYFYRINEQSVTQRRLNNEYEIWNLSKTLKALQNVVNQQYLMALFTIMRVRQVAENIFLNNKLDLKEKKKLLSDMRNDIEVSRQLQIIQKEKFYKRFHKSHRLFYKIFSNKLWEILGILFAIKRNCKYAKKTANDGFIRFK